MFHRFLFVVQSFFVIFVFFVVSDSFFKVFMTSDEIVKLLDLKPHPEGGFYRETYRSPRNVPGTDPPRAYSTTILYLLVSGAVSKLHRIAGDEVFHFYLGDPVTWVLLKPGGKFEKVVLGSLLGQGQELQMLVPSGTWFGGYLSEGGLFTLMGTTVAPAFEFGDLAMGEREELLAQFPQAQAEILKLT
jgi:predicted cupin superfamily sugar epimerase